MSLDKIIRSSLFSREKQSIEQQIQFETLARVGIGAVAVASMGCTLAFPQYLDRESKLFLLLLNTASSIGLVASLEAGEKKHKIFETFEKAQLNSYRESVFQDITIDKSIHQIEGQRELAAYVSTLPVYEHARWINQYELGSLVPPSEQPRLEQEEIDPNIEVPIQAIQIRQQLEHVEEQTGLDLEWLDSDFIRGSKVVVGGRGSGKSYYLKYEATRYFLENQQDILIILDPHFDENSLGVGEQWLSDIPIDLLKRYVTKKPQDIYIKLMDVSKELKRRIDNSLKLPKVSRIKVILDEEENLKRNLNDDQFEAFQDTLSLIQDEGRKYGVEITIAMHSLKKENTGIDSANLQQMNWLVFHKSAYDPTTKYPADFEPLQIKKKAKRLASQVNRDYGRVTVVVKQDEVEPLITVLPLLPIPVIKLDTQQESNSTDTTKTDYIPVIKNWYFKVKTEYGYYPTDDDLLEAWFQITGERLTEKGLMYLRDMIHKNN